MASQAAEKVRMGIEIGADDPQPKLLKSRDARKRRAAGNGIQLRKCGTADRGGPSAEADTALRELSSEFDRLYAAGGRPSIAPEKLLRGLLLQVLYSPRSERLLMEEMNYNLLFRWFVGLEMDDEVWDVTVFTKNRERLIGGKVAQKFFAVVVEQARARGLLSDEHFTVHGTLIEAWANRRSFVEKKEPPQRGTGARGRKLLRDTQESTTDPEGRLAESSGRVVSQLFGACDHGEPEWVGGRGLCNPVERHGRKRGGDGHAGVGKRWPSADHAGGGQGISGEGFPAAHTDSAGRTPRGGVCRGHESLAERIAQRRAG